MSQSREREKLLKLYISILPPEMEITFPTTACTWPSQCWGNNISKNKFVKTNLSHIRNPLILPNAHRQCIIVLAVGPTGWHPDCRSLDFNNINKQSSIPVPIVKPSRLSGGSLFHLCIQVNLFCTMIVTDKLEIMDCKAWPACHSREETAQWPKWHSLLGHKLCDKSKSLC